MLGFVWFFFSPLFNSSWSLILPVVSYSRISLEWTKASPQNFFLFGSPPGMLTDLRPLIFSKTGFLSCFWGEFHPLIGCNLGVAWLSLDGGRGGIGIWQGKSKAIITSVLITCSTHETSKIEPQPLWSLYRYLSFGLGELLDVPTNL